ncbi:TonB-dependent receptor [Leptolyngbya sp. 7M]|uniref:TonB-dependent receptor n=1 Tax=Leptolyngbya sp. 7M TaxID=2812896 RepID=UPI001B8B0369|nr:TonB-dependent receptor [Leptolyngbya sp. 7M]QYO65333.1 TonB-dependent receptor [Leptolyngbya sp. 7M]
MTNSSFIRGEAVGAVLLITFLFVLVHSLQAQVNGRFIISVTDPSGSVVAGASVRVSARNLLERVVITNENGEASLIGIPQGELWVRIDAPGFTSQSVIVSNTENNSAVTVVLLAGNIAEKVTVTAERTQVSTVDTAKPVSVVGREELERKAVSSVGDLFRTLPGASTVNEGGFQVRPRIRGLDSNRVLVLVDGERLNHSRTSTQQSGIELGLVEISQIESVEVIRGSGSVLYGTDALAGTINIITRDVPPRHDQGFRFGGSLDTFFSTNEHGRRGNLAFTGAGRSFAFRLMQSLERFGNYKIGELKGTIIDGITSDGEVLNSQHHGGNTQAIGRFFLNDKNTLKIGYERRRAANIGSPTLVGVFNGFFPFSNRDKFSVRFDSAAITNTLARVSVSGFHQGQDRNFTNVLTVQPILPFFPGQYQFSETITRTNTTGFDLQTDWILGKRLNLIAGASLFRDKNQDERLLITSTTPWDPNRRTSNSRSVPNATLSNIAVFAQAGFRISSRVRLVGGLRADRFYTKAEPTTQFGLPPSLTPSQIEDLGLTGLTSGLDVKSTSLTGEAGMIVSMTDKFTLSARIGNSFRTPNIFERFFTDFGSVAGFVVGNPRLEPETGVNFDMSAKYRSDRFSLVTNYFNNYYRNFLSTQTAMDRNGVPITLPGSSPANRIQVFQTQNVRRAQIQGFEAELEVPIKIRLGYLTSYGNFSYLRGDDIDRDVPLDTISPFRTNAGLRWENFLKNYYFDYSTRIVVTQRRLSPAFLLPVNQGGNGGPEPGFVTHNMSGGYRFRRERFNFGINVAVSNIGNRLYSEQFVFAPARGRSLIIGTTWTIR